jgi:transcriptional regulator with XRE-family HTH domain
MVRKEEALRQFGNRLAALREQKKLSIPELAAAAALESELVGQIEAGQVNLLLTTILALAKGLGIPPDELLGPARE